MSKYLLSKYFTFSTAKKLWRESCAALYIFSLLIWTILRQKVGTYENNLSLNICIPPLHPRILKSWGMWLWALKPVWWTWVLKTGVCCCLLFLPSKNRHRSGKPYRNTSVQKFKMFKDKALHFPQPFFLLNRWHFFWNLKTLMEIESCSHILNNQIQLMSRHMAVGSYLQAFVSRMVIYYLSFLLEYELKRADTKRV